MAKLFAWVPMGLLVLGVMAGAASAEAQVDVTSVPLVEPGAAALTARIAALEKERSQLTIGEPLSVMLFGSIGALSTLGYGWFTMLAPDRGEHYGRNILITSGAFAAIAAAGAGWMIQRNAARHRLDRRLIALRIERVQLAPVVGPSGGVLSVSAVFDGP
jgi:hypothetical protein